MPLALEAGPATVGEIIVPIVVALVTVAGAILVPRLNAGSDDLRRAEQLTAILEGMSDSPDRDLVRRVRDDHASSWALRAAAPTYPRVRVAGQGAYYAGLVVLVVSAVALERDRAATARRGARRRPAAERARCDIRPRPPGGTRELTARVGASDPCRSRHALPHSVAGCSDDSCPASTGPAAGGPSRASRHRAGPPC